MWLPLVGLIISVGAVIWTLIVAELKMKLIYGAAAIVLVILASVLPGRAGSVVLVIGAPILGLCCLIYLIWKGYIFKMR